jgi:predicted transcriptional regulator
MKSTLLLSIHPHYADGILAGVKRVELRRRLPRIAAGDAVVIYATVPTTAVVGFFTVESVERLPLGPLWRRVRDVAGVTRAEYLAYFDGLVEGVAIFVRKAQRLSQPLPLRQLRALWPGFHPPQGFRYLDAGAVDQMCSLTMEVRRAA